MLKKLIPGKVTVTEDEIIIEGFTFKLKHEGKQENEEIEAGADIIELQKAAIKWAICRLQERLTDYRNKERRE